MMFENKLKSADLKASDPFAQLGDSGSGNNIDSETPFSGTLSDREINPHQHFVNPHYVEGYTREDGTYVEGYWRDGDGNTDIDLDVHHGGGYQQTNPDDNPFNNLNLPDFDLGSES